jgi:hypothetical protein
MSLLLVFLVSSCKKVKFENFPTVIRLNTDLPFGSIVTLMLATEETMDEFRETTTMPMDDGSTKTIEQIIHEYGIGTVIGWVDNEDGIVEFEIDWLKDVPGVGSPHNNNLTLIPYYFIDTSPHDDADFADYGAANYIFYGQKLGEVTEKLTPKVVYDWDAFSDELVDSGERTEKIDRSVSKTNNSGTGAVNCDLNNYDGPNFNIQIDSQCKTAYAYDCAGNADGVTLACALYKQYQDEDPSIPDCPYCP